MYFVAGPHFNVALKWTTLIIILFLVSKSSAEPKLKS